MIVLSNFYADVIKLTGTARATVTMVTVDSAAARGFRRNGERVGRTSLSVASDGPAQPSLCGGWPLWRALGDT